MELRFRQKNTELLASDILAQIPKENLLGILRPNQIEEPLINLEEEKANLAAKVKEFLNNAHRVLVLLNDYTRPTPNEIFLEFLEPELKARETKFLICLGSHRPAKEMELKRICGEKGFSWIKDRVLQHNFKDRAHIFFLGKTKFGTEVWLNREILWAERIITINSIEPHYFAGYTGGRKCFIPGIAGHDTICSNHNLLLHPASAPLSLKGNPVHEDMTEAAKMVQKPIFSIQVVIGENHSLLSLHSGDLFDSFNQACANAYKVFAVPIKEKADIVLSILQPPYDINFYQSQRAVEFALPALKPGGVQITVSNCYDGLGDTGFIQVLQKCSSPEEVLEQKPRLTLGWYKAARLAKILKEFSLYTVMGIEDRVVRSVFMEPFNSVEEALNSAFKRRGRNATLYLIPDAGSVVPVLRGT